MSEMPRILVVEDTPETLELNAALLREAGYAVIEARCGEEAIRLATASLPDLVLLDVVLPDLSGFAVCRRLKVYLEVGRCAVLLISSAETASETQAEGLEGGADGYIARPISNRELLARVEAMLRLKRGEEATRASRARAVADGSRASSASSSPVWYLLIWGVLLGVVLFVLVVVSLMEGAPSDVGSRAGSAFNRGVSVCDHCGESRRSLTAKDAKGAKNADGHQPVE